MISALEAFIMEKKISEAHYQKMQSFYRAEAKIDPANKSRDDDGGESGVKS